MDASARDAALDSVDDAALPDTAMLDGAPPCKSFSTLFDTCALSSSTSNLVLTGSVTYNTDTHVLAREGSAETQPAHQVVSTQLGPIDVLLVNRFSLSTNAILTVTGSRPFGIVASGTVSIRGALDLSKGGAGARSAEACAESNGKNGTARTGGAGGAGGAGFQGRGGSGGGGDVREGVALSAGGQGGVAVQARPKGLLGGCSGGNGGDGDPQTGGIGGAGGGAMVVATPGTLVVSGSIDAGGGGGGGGKVKNAGGGGGGSGGMILLECKTLQLTGKIAANGGGGGEGAGTMNGGAAGSQGMLSSQPAPGGMLGAAFGADGGNGGAGTGEDIHGVTVTTAQAGGGGGGGGGTGFIAIACSPFTTDGVISPPFAPWP